MKESGRWESEREGDIYIYIEREREWENQGERKAPCLAFKLIRTIDI